MHRAYTVFILLIYHLLRPETVREMVVISKRDADLYQPWDNVLHKI